MLLWTQPLALLRGFYRTEIDPKTGRLALSDLYQTVDPVHFRKQALSLDPRYFRAIGLNPEALRCVPDISPVSSPELLVPEEWPMCPHTRYIGLPISDKVRCPNKTSLCHVGATELHQTWAPALRCSKSR